LKEVLSEEQNVRENTEGYGRYYYCAHYVIAYSHNVALANILWPNERLLLYHSSYVFVTYCENLDYFLSQPCTHAIPLIVDGKRPLVCLDRAARQLTGETRAPAPMAPGRGARQDCEYKRNGTASLFLLFTPL
jgi:hypothetical protein